MIINVIFSINDPGKGHSLFSSLLFQEPKEEQEKGSSLESRKESLEVELNKYQDVPLSLTLTTTISIHQYFFIINSSFFGEGIFLQIERQTAA